MSAEMIIDEPQPTLTGLRMVVFGTGYLGATHAACMAELGHEVLGVDIDEAKIARLEAGEVPFFEPGLSELLLRNVRAGRLKFATSYADAAEWGDIHFIGVGTPQKKGQYAANMKYVDAVVEQLAPLITRPAVIFGKSTVPVGNASRLGELARRLSPVGDQVEVAWNPEFLREGFAVADTLTPDRLVLGVDPDRPGQAEAVARQVYAKILATGTPFIVTDPATAELVKCAANSFLATKISFINAMAELCGTVGADVTVLADAIGHDVRIGRRFLNAGVGFGGGCLPKDIRAFMARAGELGADHALAFLREVDNVNIRRQARVSEIVHDILGGAVLGKKVAVLGAAFKPDSDDVRDSPALYVAGQVQLRGAEVMVCDPKATENARRAYPTLQYTDDVETACAGADLVLLLTEWAEFRSLDPVALASVVRSPAIFDGRNCLDREAWRAAGWTYYGYGRP